MQDLGHYQILGMGLQVAHPRRFHGRLLDPDGSTGITTARTWRRRAKLCNCIWLTACQSSICSGKTIEKLGKR